MARRSRWTVAAVAAATVAVGAGAAVVIHQRRKSKSPRVPNPTPRADVRPTQCAAVEPREGFESRWAEQRTQVLAMCQREVDVTSYPQALTCALNAAYPEAAPWTDPLVWTAWMRAAAELVADELRAATGGPEGAPQGWEVRAWLSGPQALAGCGPDVDEPALCAARQLYPWANWTQPMPWQRDLVGQLSRMVSA